MHKEKILIIVAVLVILTGFAYWYFALRELAAILPPVETEEGAQPASLGEQLLEEAQNPLKGEVPELKPVVNPVEGLYENPFE